MKLLAISIQGFRSFAKEQTFTFPQNDRGFYLVCGRNEVEPDLGANGAGKSSLWEALVWCLYGKTSRGLKSKAVAHWGEEHLTSVAVDFEKDGILHGLTRSWNPNALALQIGGEDPRTIDQPELDEIIGIPLDTFLHTVVLSQFGHYFFDLGPTDKLAVFSQILRLEFWARCSDQAKKNVKGKEEELNLLSQEAASLEGSITKIEEWHTQVKRECREFDATRDKEVIDLKAKMDGIVEDLDALRPEIISLTSIIQNLEDEVQQKTDSLVSIDDKENDCIKKIAACESELGAQGTQIRKIRKRIEIFKESNECPVCKTPLSSLQSVLKYYQQDLRDLNVAYGDTEACLGVCKREVKAIVGQARGIGDEIDRLENRVTSLRKKHGAMVREKEEADRLHEGIVTKREGLLNKKNPWTDREASLGTQVATEKKKLKATHKERVSCGLMKDRISYWVKGFKDVRLWVTEEALTEFEVGVNNALADLGMEGWSITFDIERPKADGGTTRGFSVFVRSPDGVVAPWEAWSGGETQRLRIAGALGLSDLIRARTGFSSSVEVWDEPTAHLSQQGIDDLLRFFRLRSIQEGKQIWMVDHRTLNAGEFDDEIMIVKKKDGSVFQ